MNQPLLVDSHAHLDFDKLFEELDAVLRRAGEAGVDRILTVGTDLSSSRRALDMAREHPGVFAAAGVHPHDAGEFEEHHWAGLAALWGEQRVVAVGETGLDFFYNHSSPAQQRRMFERQLEASRDMDMPVVIHLRDAFDDGFAAIDRIRPPAGVLHCFSGGPAECERALALGLHISLSGIVTFPGADELREAAKMIPDDRLLVETDAPFLAPVPVRGQRNEPAYVTHTAREVARVRNVDLAEICRLTRANAISLFGLPE